MFIGSVSDNFDERIEQKIVYAEIVIEVAKVNGESKAYEPTPITTEFLNEDDSDSLRDHRIQLQERQARGTSTHK